MYSIIPFNICIYLFLDLIKCIFQNTSCSDFVINLVSPLHFRILPWTIRSNTSKNKWDLYKLRSVSYNVSCVRLQLFFVFIFTFLILLIYLSDIILNKITIRHWICCVGFGEFQALSLFRRIASRRVASSNFRLVKPVKSRRDPAWLQEELVALCLLLFHYQSLVSATRSREGGKRVEMPGRLISSPALIVQPYL